MNTCIFCNAKFKNKNGFCASCNCKFYTSGGKFFAIEMRSPDEGPACSSYIDINLYDEYTQIEYVINNKTILKTELRWIFPRMVSKELDRVKQLLPFI